MGTGIVSILIHNLPYNGVWLYWISVVIFALNVVIFTTFLILSLLRYTIYPEIWLAMIRHPAQSLFLGTIPMGFATIVNMIVFVCVPAWGAWAVQLVRTRTEKQYTSSEADFSKAWALWWLDVVMSLFTCLYLPFVMYFQSTRLSQTFQLMVRFQHVRSRDRPTNHDRRLAPPHSRPHSRGCFRRYRCRSSSQPASRPVDRNHKLYSLGYRCAPRYGSLSHLLPATHITQIASPRSHRLRLPPPGSPWPRRLRGHAIRKSLNADLSSDKHTARSNRCRRQTWGYIICHGLGCGSCHVGICDSVAVFRAREYQPKQVSVQHGLVGVHFSAGGAYGFNHYNWEGNRVEVLRCARHGM